MIARHRFTAKQPWQFSLRFLLALIMAECLALGLAVAFLNFLGVLYGD
jgi:hypothetical protein